MAYPRFVRSRTLVKARRTAGNLTLNSTSWADVDTGLDLTLEGVQVGDEIAYGVSGLIDNEALVVRFDVVTIVSASVVNSVGERGPVSTGEGVIAWRMDSTLDRHPLSGYAPPYTLVASDLDGAAVTLRLRYQTASASNRTLFARTDVPLDVWAMNLGPAQGA